MDLKLYQHLKKKAGTSGCSAPTMLPNCMATGSGKTRIAFRLVGYEWETAAAGAQWENLFGLDDGKNYGRLKRF